MADYVKVQRVIDAGIPTASVQNSAYWYGEGSAGMYTHCKAPPAVTTGGRAET